MIEGQKILTGPDDFVASLEPATIRSLGPELSFSDVLARTLFDSAENTNPASRRPRFRYHESFSDLARALRHDPSALGIFPVENSTTSTVQGVTDELLTGDFTVVAEATLLIHLILAGPSGAPIDPDDVKAVLSHPKPFGQARNVMTERDYKPIPVESTAKAASIVQKSKDRTIAAICGARAVRTYELQTILDGIEDREDNSTRFMLVKSMEGNGVLDIEIARSGILQNVKRAKLAAIVTPKAPGARGFLNVLNYVDLKGLGFYPPLGHTNQSRIEGRSVDYFMEFEGHPEALSNALRDERDWGSFMDFKTLGMYPVGSVYSEGLAEV